MDWEKKTTARPALREAAADVFNDTKTPGQALLTALQSAETVRKDRYSSTVAAKMKAAREYLPALEPRHPPKSDATIFGKPGAEVAALLPEGGAGGAAAMGKYLPGSLRSGKVSLEHIKAMMEEQMERHNEAWEAFVTGRDEARLDLERAVAAAAASFQQRLAADDAGIAEDMSALDDDRVMRLTEQELHQVWDCVAQRIPLRARWIEECAAALEAAEERRRETVGSALVSLCAALNDAAVVSEGEVERLVEKEAMALNVAILENRRAYADLVSRLQVAEVEAERSRRAAWQDGLRRWRVLRTQHAIHTFVERIRSPEFSEPADRLAAFATLRERQTHALSALSSHWGRAGAVTPPHMSAKKVNTWTTEATALADTWTKDRQQHLGAMRAAEDALAARVGELVVALREEVEGYQGYPPEQLDELVREQAGAAVEERRQAALRLLAQTEAFLEQQAAQWAAVSAAVSGWLNKLCTMFDKHRALTAADEGEVRSALKQSREAFNAADAEREAALDAAVAAVTRGSGETQLDACVTEALKRLDDIEAGYRNFHRDMTSRARAYPGAVRAANDTYHVNLCSELGVQPQTRLGGSATVTSSGANNSPPQSKTPTTSGAAATTTATSGPVAAGPAGTVSVAMAVTDSAAMSIQIIGHIKLPDGRSFAVLQDILDLLLSQVNQPEQKERRRTADGAAAALVPDPAVKPAVGAAATDGTVEGTVEGTAAEEPPPPPPVTNPTSSSGTALCRTLALPNDTLRRAIESIQAGMLSDMMTFNQRTVEAADSWAAEREVSLTQELDSWLRHHRPRAGRIEEEVRTARSVELVAQRRRVELHLKAQSKAVKAQAAGFDEGLRALEAEVRKGVARLRATEDFLGQCLSSKSIGIRQREAEGLRVRLDKDMTAKLSDLEEKTKAAIAKITDANRKFEADELRTFESGGKYAEDNASAYKRSLAAIDSHLERAGAEQMEQLEAAREALTGEATAALDHVVSLVPSHLEDMELIERMDALVEGARKKAAGELERNKAAAASITTQLERLESLLDGRKGANGARGTNGAAAAGGAPARGRSPSRIRPTSSSPPLGDLARRSTSASFSAAGLPSQGALRNGPSGGAASGAGTDEVPAAPLERCRAILECTDSLRQALLRQAKVLDFLASASLTTLPVDLRLDAAGVDPPPPPLGAESRSASPASRRVSAKGPAGSSAAAPKGGGGAAAAALAAAAAAAAAKNTVVKLAMDVEEVIDGCKKETEAVAKAYYAAKDKARPIRYPARIPATVEELLRGTDAVLEGLREQTLSYVTEAVKELRTQVIRAYRAMERLPAVALALLAEHEVSAVDGAHMGMVSELETRRGALLKLVEVHRGSLHPTMMMPTRRPELAAVKSSETDRATAHASLLLTYGTQAVDMARRQAPSLQQRLVRLATQLAQLLDSFLMPQDLPPPGDGDAWVYDLPHKDYKQLLRLALAQAEAEVAPPPPPPPEAKGKAGAKGAATASAKPAAAKAPPKGEPPPPPAPERPYELGTWTLPAGNFDLVSLGWLDEEGRLPHGLPQNLPQLIAPESLAGQQQQQQQQQQPATPPTAAAAKSGKAGGAAGKRPPSPPKAEVGVGRTPLVSEPPPLSALDTPCHRCVVRAYRAAVQRVEESLRTKMSGHRLRVASWAKDEELWSRTWAQLIGRLEGL